MWLASGQAAEVTARALGISVFHLYEWKKRVSQVTRAAGGAWLTREQGGVAVGGAAPATGKPPANRATRHPKKSRGHPLRTAAERYARIKKMSGEYPIKVLCATLTVSRSGYYAWGSATDSTHARRDRELRAKIAVVHQQSRETYGSPRITVELRAQGEEVGRHRVARLMRQEGLWGRQRRRYRVRTTDSRHSHPIAPNRLAALPVPTKPDQVWVSDLTYVPTDEGWLYVAGVLDRCSRCLVGWVMGSTLDTSVPLAALMMALRQRQPRPGLIHHSDRGVQYASADYRSALADHGLVASMSRRGNCYDNAAMEAFWSSLKNELVHRRRFATRADARTAIFDYIESFYNRSRRHSSLGYQSPLDYESSLS